MAKRRYKVISVAEQKQFKGCPARIDKSHLLFDVEDTVVILRVDMTNIGEKEILSAFLNVECFDSKGNLLSVMKRVPYANVSAPPGEVFGFTQVIEIPSLRTSKVKIELCRLEFMDGTEWVLQPKKKRRPDVTQEMEPVTSNFDTVVLKTVDLTKLDYSTLDKTNEEIIGELDAAEALQSEKTELKKDAKRTMIRVMILAAVLAVIAGSVYGVYRYRENRTAAYNAAMQLYDEGSYQEAAEAFAQLTGDYKFAEKDRKEILWCKSMSYVELGEYGKAVKGLWDNGDYKDSYYNLREIVNAYRDALAAGNRHSVALRKNGEVRAAGDNSLGQCDVDGWSGITAVAAGGEHTVALNRSGKVQATGDNEFGQCDVGSFDGIIAVAAGEDHTVALKNNGRVVAKGSNKYGQCDVTDWGEIVAIAAGKYHTVGLKADGTAVATGWNYSGQCNVSDWKDIILVSAGNMNSAAVNKKGETFVVGDNQYGQCDTDSFEEMLALSVGEFHVTGLKNTGRILAVGNNDQKQSAVSLWKNAVAVAAGGYHTLCMTRDGAVFAVGNNDSGQCEVGGWDDIGIPEGVLQMVAY